MENQKKFFHDYFDGQIIKEDSEKYKLFKLMLTSIVALFGMFCWLSGFCATAYFVLLVLGMIWNFYIKIESKMAIVFCVLVSAIYFVIASNYRLYSSAMIYMGFYIPFQMFATTKKYYGGSFVQIKKEMYPSIHLFFAARRHSAELRYSASSFSHALISASVKVLVVSLPQLTNTSSA